MHSHELDPECKRLHEIAMKALLAVSEIMSYTMDSTFDKGYDERRTALEAMLPRAQRDLQELLFLRLAQIIKHVAPDMAIDADALRPMATLILFGTICEALQRTIEGIELAHPASFKNGVN